jgi:hypothetical protein
MLAVAAVAVVFEMVPWLRGGLGNVAYFFLFVFAMATGIPEVGRHLPIGDPAGIRLVMPSLERACARAYPDFKVGSGNVSVGISFSPRSQRVTPFAWEGVRWTPQAVGLRAAWGVVALALTLLAAKLFDRFDSARALVGGGPKRRRRVTPAVLAADAAEVEQAAAPPPPHRSAATLTAAPRAERFAPLLRAELTLLFKGVSRWWLLVALALAVLCLTLPLAAVRSVTVVLAAIWPILLWSAMGWREARFGADALLFSAPRPLRRQLLATWFAGVVLAAAATGTFAFRLALAGDGASLLGWIAGVLFVPSFALASGVWTGSGKLFEIAYLVLWYVGPLNHAPALDYLGAAQGAHGAHGAFLAAALALLALAYLGRARQLRQ